MTYLDQALDKLNQEDFQQDIQALLRVVGVLVYVIYLLIKQVMVYLAYAYSKIKEAVVDASGKGVSVSSQPPTKGSGSGHSNASQPAAGTERTTLPHPQVPTGG